MKNLIAYYSFTQNNEKLANHLRAILRCDIVRIETLKKRTGFSILLDLLFNRIPALKTVPYYLRDYDHVIFIAPIWAGKIAMPLKTFLLNEKANINHYSFVTLCGGGNADQKSKIQKELVSLVGKAPSQVFELWINDLLSAEKKGKVKFTSGFRIESNSLTKFDAQIRNFLKEEDLINAI